VSQSPIDLLNGTPWLITPQCMQVLVAAAEQMGQVESVATRRGRYVPGTLGDAEIRDGVGILNITGMIMRFDSWWFRAASIDSMATDLRTMLDDPAVRAIVLNIDSPGGSTNGVNEFAEMVYKARQEKPIVAYSGNQMASAAYWIGSAAQEIVIDAMTVAGSIGAVYTYIDDSDAEQRRGYRRYQIASSQSPSKILDLRIDTDRAKVQKMVDDMGAIFVEAVARNRDVSAETVVQDFGQGGMLVGREAVAAGLADRIGSLESVLAEVSAEVNPRRSFTIMNTKAGKGPIMVSTTAELRAALAAGHTGEDITIQTIDIDPIRASAKAEGIAEEQARSHAAAEAARTESVNAERTRISGIHAITLAGFEAMAAEAIAKGQSPGDFAVAQTKAAKERGGTVEGLRAQATQAVNHGGEQNPNGGGDNSGKRPWSQAVEKYKAKQAR
jgi:signal peptide peptidase SppA